MNTHHCHVSFGIIVLNGEPFTRYCLRSLYPFAHEIIVVEGAVRDASAIATRAGHSIDETLEALFAFKSEEDPEDKLRIITKDGFWDEKDEMSAAYAAVATGDYLWQVDIDEFYRPEDMECVIHMLNADPSITAVSFRQIQFWGGFCYIVDSWFLRNELPQFHRLFRWGPGYSYATHRPPTVLNDRGVDARDIHWVDAEQMNDKGIRMLHYSFVFPQQVRTKSIYYAHAKWGQFPQMHLWAEAVFMHLSKPFRVFDVYSWPGWLERYDESHPFQIEELRRDLTSGTLNIEVRDTEDIERLLDSPLYRLIRSLLRSVGPVMRNRLVKRCFFIAQRLLSRTGIPGLQFDHFV